MQAQQAILTFNEADRTLGSRLLKIAIEIDRIEGYSEPHAIAIAWAAEKIGARMGLHGIDLTALKFAALAHDLGERAMKRDYLLLPRELSWEEILDLWRHPILGEQAAGELKLPRQTQLLIRWHHEWWNGGGYPDGLAGESIPLGARILRAVDSYFALISERPHRRRFDRNEAEQVIADLAGIEFDPQVVKLLLQVLEESSGEGPFSYPYPDSAARADETVTRPVEDQPQPLGEVVYVSTYANQQSEIPAESSSGGHNAAPGPAAQIPSIDISDEGASERRPEMAATSSASELIGEVAGETQTEIAVADFASSDTIDEAVIETWTDAPTAELVLPKPAEELKPSAQMVMVRDDLTTPNAPPITDENLIESRKTTLGDDLISSETPGEAGANIQTGSAGVETRITQERKEETES